VHSNRSIAIQLTTKDAAKAPTAHWLTTKCSDREIGIGISCGRNWKSADYSSKSFEKLILQNRGGEGSSQRAIDKQDSAYIVSAHMLYTASIKLRLNVKT
jgi:hypothetical protein